MKRTLSPQVLFSSAFGLGLAALATLSCDIGVVGRECRTSTPDLCGADSYCHYSPSDACGEDDAIGECRDRPDACTAELDPVCGCDGMTYGNACEAASAGVSVARQGSCEPAEPTGCGGDLDGCAAGEYCRYDEGTTCDAEAPEGTCEPVPEACGEIYDPVCACDGRTFGNPCEAARAGVSIYVPGECPPDPSDDACGGIAGLPCADDEYCDYGPEATCGAADLLGTCEPRPTACEDIYEPVCSCDDRTFGNACEAAAAGVSVFSPGACDDPEPPAACSPDQPCPEGETCRFPEAVTCETAAPTGTCDPVPEACDAIYQPVCSCDGVTYENDCAAARAGAGIVTPGACEPPSGETCGGIAGLTCAEGEYCEFAPDVTCEFADAQGVCRALPTACTREYDPVCSCDGQTFTNACEAARAGISVTVPGECEP